MYAGESTNLYTREGEVRVGVKLHRSRRGDEEINVISLTNLILLSHNKKEIIAVLNIAYYYLPLCIKFYTDNTRWPTQCYKREARSKSDIRGINFIKPRCASYGFGNLGMGLEF